MVDVAALVIVVLTVAAVMIRKTSAGVGIMSLLAGVMLDQLLGSWVLAMIPRSDALAGQYVTVVVHLILTFAPVVAALSAVKVRKHNQVLSLLASLTLGFLIIFFGLKIVAPLPEVAEAAKNSGLLHFLDPYQNTILAGSAVLGVAEMVLSSNKKSDEKDKKK